MLPRHQGGGGRVALSSRYVLAALTRLFRAPVLPYFSYCRGARAAADPNLGRRHSSALRRTGTTATPQNGRGCGAAPCGVCIGVACGSDAYLRGQCYLKTIQVI